VQSWAWFHAADWVFQPMAVVADELTAGRELELSRFEPLY
jgi:hypothetical protein